MAVISDILVQRSPTAAAAEVDGQLVALDVNKGVCYGLNAVATRIWQLIETPTNVDAIVATLIDEYDVEEDVCLEQTLALIDELMVIELAVRA